MARYIKLTYDETSDIKRYAEHIQDKLKEYYFEKMTLTQVKNYLKARTSLVKIEEGKYELSPEEDFDGELIPARYLMID